MPRKQKLPSVGLRGMEPSIWRGRPHVTHLSTVYGVLDEHDEGQFARSARLAKFMLRDDRIAACSETRLNGLFAHNQEFPDAKPRERRRIEAWWWKTIPETVLRQLTLSLVMLGVAFGEVIWKRSKGQWYPAELKFWDAEHFYWDSSARQFMVSTEEGVFPVRHGDGRWVIFGSGDRPWLNGLLRSLAMPWIVRAYNYRDWARFGERFASGILLGRFPLDAEDEPKDNFLRDLFNLGADGHIGLPTSKDGESYDVDLLQAGGAGWQSFEAMLDRANTSIAIRFLGQNLTTEVQGGSHAAGKVHDHVRADYKRSDSQTVCTALHSGILEPWGRANHGPDYQPPWPAYQIDPGEDLGADATRLSTLAGALEKLEAWGIDLEPVLERHGLSRRPDAPKPKPPGDEPDPGDEAETEEDPKTEGGEQQTSKQAALATSAHPGARNGEAFADELVEAAAGVATDAVDTMLAPLMSAIRSADNLESLQEKLPKLYAELPTEPLAELVAQVGSLAELAGGLSAAEDASS